MAGVSSASRYHRRQMDEKQPSSVCQKCIAGKLFHVGEVSGMIDILAPLARDGVVLQTFQQVQLLESTASAIRDVVAGDGGVGFKRMVERLGYDSSRSFADKNVRVWKGGCFLGGIRKSRIAVTSKVKEGIEYRGSVVDRTFK